MIEEEEVEAARFGWLGRPTRRLAIGDVDDHRPQPKWPAHRNVHKDPAWERDANALLLEQTPDLVEDAKKAVLAGI
jgi:hypothetical protein